MVPMDTRVARAYEMNQITCTLSVGSLSGGESPSPVSISSLILTDFEYENTENLEERSITNQSKYMRKCTFSRGRNGHEKCFRANTTRELVLLLVLWSEVDR